MNGTARLELFDSFERVDATPARYTERSFEFLNRVRSPWWHRVRHALEQWFADYPADHQADLRARFRSPRHNQHWPAWWELYLFRLFACLGYEIEVHPKLKGSNAKPDFYLLRGESAFYMEALTVLSGIVEEGRAADREAWILDTINEVQSSTFSVSIDFEQVGQQRPRRVEITRPLKKWLATLDPDVVASTLKGGSDPPSLRLPARDWVIVLEAFPTSPEHRGDPPGRLLGAGPMSGGAVDDVERLRAALKRKCAHYPRLDKPLVLAVLSMSSFGDAESFEQALLGSHAVQYTVGIPRNASWVRLRNGAWMSGHRASGTNVSAALTASHLAPWQVTTKLPLLWRNPWSAKGLDEDLPFPQALATEEGVVTYVEGTGTAVDVLGLAADWPGPEVWAE